MKKKKNMTLSVYWGVGPVLIATGAKLNITAIKLVLVEAKTGSIVMYKILTVVVAFFECAHINSTFLGYNSIPLVLILCMESVVTYHNEMLCSNNYVTGRIYGQSSKNSCRFDKLATARTTEVATTTTTTTTTTTIWLVNDIYKILFNLTF